MGTWALFHHQVGRSRRFLLYEEAARLVAGELLIRQPSLARMLEPGVILSSPSGGTLEKPGNGTSPMEAEGSGDLDV